MAIVDQVVSECWASSVICIVDSDHLWRRSSISMAADAEVEPDFKFEQMMYTRVSGGDFARRSVRILAGNPEGSYVDGKVLRMCAGLFRRISRHRHSDVQILQVRRYTYSWT